ncbi:MAG: SCO family protein [Acidimicrobiales bacterium]|jgi:cytochrome oxidase Cu insertion factor (SCO1/SenC/PrrC family)
MSMGTGNSQMDAPLSAVDRAAAFAAGPARISRRVVIIVLAAAAALALLGVLGEDLFSSVGLNPVPPKTSPVATPTTLPPGIPQLDAPLPAFMGIVAKSAPAPAFTLRDQRGGTVSLRGERGKVVVLSFFSTTCTDICPVVEAEMAKAEADLGRQSAKVVFLSVNTDPLSPSVSATAPAVIGSDLSREANWHLLGGSLAALDSVWRIYGVQVIRSRTTGVVAHNDALYFINPAGKLSYEAFPYSNETRLGTFSLPPADIARWAKGIASYAEQLLRHRS